MKKKPESLSEEDRQKMSKLMTDRIVLNFRYRCPAMNGPIRCFSRTVFIS